MTADVNWSDKKFLENGFFFYDQEKSIETHSLTMINEWEFKCDNCGVYISYMWRSHGRYKYYTPVKIKEKWYKSYIHPVTCDQMIMKEALE